MNNKEKKRKLKKEIEQLEAKKEEDQELKELFDKRNRLKFKKLYSMGDFMKKMGSGIADWADKKNAQLEQEEKERKKNPNKKESSNNTKPLDVYDALFGNEDINKQLGF